MPLLLEIASAINKERRGGPHLSPRNGRAAKGRENGPVRGWCQAVVCHRDEKRSTGRREATSGETLDRLRRSALPTPTAAKARRKVSRCHGREVEGNRCGMQRLQARVPVQVALQRVLFSDYTALKRRRSPAVGRVSCSILVGLILVRQRR